MKKRKEDEEWEEEDNRKGDDDYGDEGAGEDDHWFSDSSTSSTEEKEPRLRMYAQYTQYEVVKEVARLEFNWHLTRDDQKEWDIAWFDGPISIKLLQKMWPH